MNKPHLMTAMSERLLSLESARGVAALLVVLFHATEIMSSAKYYSYEAFDGFFRFGYAGVDFFFVLSGFIILYVHFDDIGNVNSVSNFLRKRLIRIYPIYWVVTLIVVCVIFMMPLFTSEIDTIHIIKSIFLIPQDRLPIVGVGWTLIYEVFFYLLFSILIICPTLGWTIIVTVVLAIISSGLMGMHLDDENWSFSLSFLLNLHHLEFFLGMLIGFFIRSGWKMKYSWTVFYIAVASLLLTGIINTGNTNSDLFTLIYAIISGVIILCLASSELTGRIYIPDWMTFLGAASYSTYLVHYLALSVLAKLTMLGGIESLLPLWMIFTLLVLMAVIAGSCFHLLVEKPLLLSLRKRFV